MFLKNRNISSKIKRSKVTDYAALRNNSQGARFLKIDLAQLSRQKRFDFRNSKNYTSTTFLGTSYSQIVVEVFQEKSFCTPSPFYYKIKMATFKKEIASRLYPDGAYGR